MALLALAVPAAAAPPSRLQRALTRAMAGRSGAAAVLDVASGRRLAHYHLEAAARRLVRPGSALKTFTLLAMLDLGRIPAGAPLVCGRHLRVGGHRLDCSHPEVAEPLTPATALAYSCNFYFVHMAEQLHDSDLPQALASFGLTSPTGLVAREAVGSVLPPASLEERQMLAIGEGNIQVTPLELLWAYRSLALRVRAHDSSPALATVVQGLEFSADFGMARLARPQGLPVAGKTGTALSEGAWTHGWFAGWAPARAPEIVIVVFLERGRGPTEAAPIARQVFAAYQSARERQ